MQRSDGRYCPMHLMLNVRVMQRLLLVVFSCLLPLFLLEVLFRSMGPMLPGSYVLGIEREFDPELGWKNRPMFIGGGRTDEYATQITSNSRGIRGQEVSYEKPPDIFRILLLGDSFIKADQVSIEDTIARQIEHRFRRDTPYVQVINGGVTGFGTAQEYLYLDTELYKYNPDIVVLVFFIGNDIFNNRRPAAATERVNRPIFDLDEENRLMQVHRPRRDEPHQASPNDWLVRHSTVYNFFRSGVLEKFSDQDSLGEGGRDVKHDLQIYDRRPPRRIAHTWRVTEKLLAATAHRTQSLGARFLVVAAPSFRQLDPVQFNRVLVEQGLDPGRFDIEFPNRQLQQAASNQGLDYLDLLPALRDAARTNATEIFFPRDAHWTPAGHQAAAAAVYAHLAASLVPAGRLPGVSEYQR